MFSDTHTALITIKDMISGFDSKSNEDRVCACSCVLLITDELGRTLDPQWAYHDYFSLKLGKLVDAVNELWALCRPCHEARIRIHRVTERIRILAMELDASTRWLSAGRFRKAEDEADSESPNRATACAQSACQVGRNDFRTLFRH